MEYISTRGVAPDASFDEVLLAGLAPDGGLYMPVRWPSFSRDEIAAFAGRPYGDIAAAVMNRFTTGAYDENSLRAIAHSIYECFADPEVAPIKPVGDDDYILELFHGPTLAFKDFAMQFLGRLFDDVLARRSKRLTIIAATSGDTGAAAIEALKSCERVDIVVLHPEGRVTDVQRRMMTNIDAPNVLNIAIAGSFDDCQVIVKQLFADNDFVERVSLGGVNSINWARLAAQAVYYFTAYAAVAKNDELVNFVVPTGNFGDVFAGYAAKQMGLPIEKLGVATNANDILHRALTSGDYSPSQVRQTASPSMDIQVASNFERLLFEAMNRDSVALTARMQGFAKNHSMKLTAEELEFIRRDFVSCAVSEDDTLDEMKRHYGETGVLIDPHTAVGRSAARKLRTAGKLSGKIITLSTAHPAKFPEAVKGATGVAPELPPHQVGIFNRREYFMKAANDAGAVKAAIINQVSASMS